MQEKPEDLWRIDTFKLSAYIYEIKRRNILFQKNTQSKINKAATNQI